jgi:hypothetical protein
MHLSREGLQTAGFEGFVPLSTVDAALIPRSPGVYVVLRAEQSRPVFLERSVAGRFKGKDPTVAVSTLMSKWVSGTDVVYIGKADARKRGGGLRQRIQEYQRFGAGKAVGHAGGAYIWQLADSASLLIAWRATGPDEAPPEVKADMIDAFVQDYGALPFANRKRGRRRP